MKTLKFMLAAATAIGLASATQADEFNTTGFEKLTVGTNVTTGVKDNTTSSYFYYAGSVAEDNESVIAEAGDMTGIARPRGAASVDAGRDKILQVSTGTDPLMRTFEPIAGDAPQAATTLTADTYVDTLVQFTVTPYTDTVTPGSADKLMIYLKESVTTNAMGEITSADTNLVAVGGYYYGGTTAKEYVLDTDTVTVLPNTWHRLTVKAVLDLSGSEGLGYPGFQIWVDGVLCTLADGEVPYKSEDRETQDLFASFQFAEQINEGKYLLSLLAGNGEQQAKLQGVGFAGEGKVDDIVFSELDPFATVYDFTFAFDNTKVSSIAYTVGGTSYTYARTFPEVTAGTEVQITSITYADAWMEGTIDAVNMGGPEAGVYTVANAGASLTITPAQFFPRTETADQDGTAAHPYEVADGAALVALQKGLLAGKNLTGKNFVLTGNIDMTGVTGFWGIGWFSSSDSKDASITASGDIPFTGVFDGAGYTISNVTLVRHNYAGLFNNVSGTVKNLTVQNIGFSGTCSEWGCAIVGNAAAGSLLSNLTAAASTVWGDNANHNVAGIVVRPIGSATIYGCVNNADITASGKRVGGVAAFVGSGSTGTVFDSCTNTAAIVSSNGTRGVGGILGCAEGNTTETATIIRNCADFGSETAQAEGGHAGAIVGSNWNGSYTYTDDGGNTFKASTVDCGYIKNQIFGRTYSVASTIGGTPCLTTVKQADLAAGNTYTLLTNVVAGTVFTLQNAGDTIAFDSNGFTDAGTVAAAEGLTASSVTSAGVTTWTAANMAYAIVYLNDDGTPFTDWAANYAAPTTYTVADTVTLPTSSDVALQVVGVSFGGWTNETGTVTGWTAGEKSGAQTFYVKLDAVVAPAGWVDDPTEISDNTPAATQYPDLSSSALATADAKKLTTWAKANSIAFADVAADTTGTYTEAFLLNCAVADVATEKAAFVLDISVAADGTITVSLPDGKTYNGTLQMKGSNNLSTWTDVSEASSSYKFYKYELSL